jgi:BirA family transcriptional regulator, biotin operon repressor / biotin---[acetyl-CoA-carboxylase] ligase
VVGAPGEQRKLAGVLAAAERQGSGVAVVVGIGCNVVGGRLAMPGAVALSELGDPPDRVELLVAILGGVDRWLTRVEAGAAHELRARWTSLSATVGTRVRVEHENGPFEGEATAVTEAGALVVVTDDGSSVEVVAGDVVSLRPA